MRRSSSDSGNWLKRTLGAPGIGILVPSSKVTGVTEPDRFRIPLPVVGVIEPERGGVCD
jgi:hypothetical protein